MPGGEGGSSSITFFAHTWTWRPAVEGLCALEGSSLYDACDGKCLRVGASFPNTEKMLPYIGASSDSWGFLPNPEHPSHEGFRAFFSLHPFASLYPCLFSPTHHNNFYRGMGSYTPHVN